MPRLRAVSFAALLVFALPAAAQDMKDFKSWFVACDNLRDCSAYGFDVELAGDARAYLRVERKGTATAPVTITIAVDYGDNAAGYTLAFDNPALPGLPATTLTGVESEDGSYRRTVLTTHASVDVLIDSIRKAQKLVITLKPAEGKKIERPVSSISLSGAVAALLWIDDQQKRLDTVTAMIRRGDKPASTIPPQPRAPVIVAAKPAKEKPPAKHPAALIKKGRALCGDDDPDSKLEEVYALGGGRVLYGFTCPGSSGAYNFQFVFLVGPAGNANAARAVSFRWPLKIAGFQHDGPQETITNPTFDEKTMTLSSFEKGRGIGDCGGEEQWVWDGRTFRLAQVRMMSECRGVPLDDWPTVYRTQVR
jgi:hypothetical protein